MKTIIAVTCLSLGVALLAGAPGCGLMCTAIGCANVITGTVSTATGVEALEGATAQVCREDQCVETGFVVNLDDASCESASNDAFSVTCNANPEGTITFSIELLAAEPDDEEDYSITVTGADGGELGAAAGTVAYEKTEINGDGCGYCYSGSF